jgi:HK97 family phage portal protein
MVAFRSNGEFASLAELSDYVAGYPGGVEIVDPGVPLTEYFSDDAPITLEALRRHPSVRKVTSFVARTVAGVPFHVYERVDDTNRQRVTGHPLAKALAAPGKGVTRFEFIRDLMMDQLLYDRFCVVWTVRRNSSELTLTRLPPRRFRIRTNPAGRVTEIVTTDTDGHAWSIDPEQCIYARGYSPRGANGISPLRTLQHVLQEAEEAVKYRRSIWKQGARIQQVIERPRDQSPEERWSAQAKSKFEQKVAQYRDGGGGEGKWLVLEDGMQLKEVSSFRPKDTQDLEGRQLTDVEVASAYFVPPELIGAREGTYSNIEAFRQMLYRQVAGPWIDGLEQAFNTHLTPQVSGRRPLYVEANVEAMLRGSFEEQATILQTSTGAPWLTRNEARARANLPAIEGGDELVVPLNVLIGDQASPTDSAPEE